MIKVLIVEDSVVVRNLIAHLLDREPDITVIGTANDGQQAVEFLAHHKPDVITMDITMPGMDGLEATRRIMETTPTPIVIVSAGLSPQDVSGTFRAIEAGAVAVVEKPRGLGQPDTNDLAHKLITAVKMIAEVKVIRRWPRRGQTGPLTGGIATGPRPAAAAGVSGSASTSLTAPPPRRLIPTSTGTKIKICAIGASTGGPPVLQTILSALPAGFPVPVLVVQHIAPGFAAGMVDWISRSTALPIRLAVQHEPLEPGHIYIAPDGFHMGVEANGRILLSSSPPENSLRPAVAHLFRSVAQVFGPEAIGILLTGMGRDGAAELKLMRDRGAITVAQDKESSIVHGMPGEAINLGAAQYILPPEKIAPLMESLALRGGEVVK